MKKLITISYGSQRIIVDTIAGYSKIYKDEQHEATIYGIRFVLRTGETIDALGDDKITRNEVLVFLDNHFQPTMFTAFLCDVCATRKPYQSGNGCQVSCHSSHNYPKFKRKKDA